MEEDWRFEMGGRRLLGHSILVVAILLVVGPGLETCSKWGRQAAGMGEDIPLWTLGRRGALARGTIDCRG